MAARVDWNDPASFTFWYSSYDPATASTVGYSRDFATGFGRHGLDEPGTSYGRRADWLEAAFTIGATDRILVVGGGFGFLVGLLIIFGFFVGFGVIGIFCLFYLFNFIRFLLIARSVITDLFRRIIWVK